jgi:hypothetical protein
MAEIGGGGGGVGGAGWIRVADVTPQDPGDSVDNKTWQDSNQTVLQSCRASSLDVTVKVQASGPKVTIDGNDFTIGQSTDEGHYEGSEDVTLAAAGSIETKVLTPNDADGAYDHFDVTYEPPPAITALSFTGGYPGSQTELKAGDTFQVAGTTDKDIDAVEIQDQDAGTYALIPVTPAAQAFNVAVTIADRGDTVQALPVHVRVRDALTDALSTVRATDQLGGSTDGVDLVNLNDFHFGLSFGSPTYPPTQQALKDSEQATVPITTDYAQVGANTIVYDSPNSQLSISNPTLHEANKTVTRIAGGYNITTANLRATLYRAANAAQTIVSNGLVYIAHDAATVNILLDDTRLRSGGMDGTSAQDHRVRIQANQQLIEAPSLAADAGGNRGTFQGAGFTGGPITWERDLRVDESVPDEKGAFTFAGLVATGLARRQQTTINSGAGYTLGGFVARNKTIPALATQVTINTEVTDLAKFVVALITSTAQPGVIMPIGTPPPVTNGITINALNVNPTTVIWLDTTAASQNTGGTAQFQGIEETV